MIHMLPIILRDIKSLVWQVLPVEILSLSLFWQVLPVPVTNEACLISWLYKWFVHLS